jgi:hypothetical protein
MIDNPPHVPSKAMFCTGRVISAIPVIFMTIGGLFFLFFAADKVVEGMLKYGYPAGAAKPILITEILCGLIYAIPQTATLGAVLMTAYLGGAVATHVHASEPFFFQSSLAFSRGSVSCCAMRESVRFFPCGESDPDVLSTFGNAVC